MIQRHNKELLSRMQTIMSTTGRVDHRNMDWKPKKRCLLNACGRAIATLSSLLNLVRLSFKCFLMASSGGGEGGRGGRVVSFGVNPEVHHQL